MVLGWLGGSKQENVDELIARKKYGPAVELLLEKFKSGNRESRLRMQLADVLLMSGKKDQAIPILVGLADEYATDGFAAKAIAVLKKIQKVEPGRADVGRKLASLIEKREGETPTTSGAMPELGMELGMDAPAVSAPVPAAQPEPPPPEPVQADTAEPDFPLDAPVAGDAGEGGEEIVHDDLLGELQAVLAGPAAQPPTARAPVASPLFSDFDSDELLAVMQGLELLEFEPGDIIITQGEPGDSLFILTTGSAKAFVQDETGHHVKVRHMPEGSFFGEISVLTGSPRTATVTAAEPCELLVLDRATLDSITAARPRVREVLEEFHAKRRDNR